LFESANDGREILVLALMFAFGIVADEKRLEIITVTESYFTPKGAAPLFVSVVIAFAFVGFP
jgi:hypothetical protein